MPARKNRNPRGDLTRDVSPLLRGHLPATSIVAVQQLDDQRVRVYTRSGDSVSHEDSDFFPFFFLSNDTLLNGLPKKYWLKQLAGTNYYRYLAVFTRWHDLWDAVRFSLGNYNKDAPKRIDSYTEADFLFLRPDPVSQYLMQSGMTLFKGMNFTDVHRMQISIATWVSKGRKSDARRTDDRILAVALSDSQGWEETLDTRKLPERELLLRLTDLIAARDPDIIEGHGLFGYELPYLSARYALHSMEFAIGRDGSEPRALPLRWTSQDPESEWAYEAAGRHLVDTLLLSETYDFSKRSLESYDLHVLADHFGFPRKRHSHLLPESISKMWKEDPKEVIASVKQNISDIASLSEHLSHSSFSLAQMVPLSYGTIARTGSAVKIESLLLREYLRQKHSVPRPERGTQTTGGYADIFATGVFSNVVHADVESLYPSIILSRNIRPRSDELDVFLRLLKDLVALRLDAKRAMNESTDATARATNDALQSSLKVLINSFYGYLGYARGLFNDYEKADEITQAGQELLRKIVKQIELYKGTVLEVDTDGVFFTPPDNVPSEEEEKTLVHRISESLPSGIHLVHAGRFRKMMSYKKKNYALLDYDGKMTTKGSALVSRSMERFLRRFLRRSIELLLNEDLGALHKEYVNIFHDVIHHRWEAFDFCRTEIIHDPFSVYEREVGEGKRNPAAAYEVARQAGILIKPGDRISYYVTGSSPNVKISENCKLAEEWDPNFADENTAYYLARLEESAQKFEVFFAPEHFRNIFTGEDLFGFQPGEISVLSRTVAAEEQGTPADDQDRLDFRIWLDEG